MSIYSSAINIDVSISADKRYLVPSILIIVFVHLPYLAFGISTKGEKLRTETLHKREFLAETMHTHDKRYVSRYENLVRRWKLHGAHNLISVYILKNTLASKKMKAKEPRCMGNEVNIDQMLLAVTWTILKYQKAEKISFKKVNWCQKTNFFWASVDSVMNRPNLFGNGKIQIFSGSWTIKLANLLRIWIFF